MTGHQSAPAQSRSPFIDLVVSFSGGRSSAFMLKRLIDSGKVIAGRSLVCFANTGLEEPETLKFVDDCSRHWGVPIVWLEYRSGANFQLVNFETASRDGRPFEDLIKDKKFLPNPVMRFCTAELKIRTIDRYLRSRNDVLADFDMCIGIRADEQRRVAKMRPDGKKDGTLGERVLPLAVDSLTVQDVSNFWKTQPFQLQLASDGKRTLAGNCSLCFMKPLSQIVSLIAEKPERAVPMIRYESVGNSSGSAAFFRNDRPAYATLAKIAIEQPDMFGFEEATLSCFCGDDA